MTFRPITLDDKKYFEMFDQGYLGCGFLFALVFVEAAGGKTEVFVSDKMLITTNYCCDRRIFYAPLLKNPSDMPKAIAIMEEVCAKESSIVDIRCVAVEQLKYINEAKYEFIINEGSADYIYNASDLINLPGKKYHKKRNHISRFIRNYPNHTVREYKETDRETVENLFQKWKSESEHVWDKEEAQFMRVLDHWKELDLKIAVLHVGDVLAAVSINAIRRDVAYTLFEKALREFDGAYQVINQDTAKLFFQDLTYVNREEDENNPGLRKSKQSYYPTMMVDKIKVIEKGKQ